MGEDNTQQQDADYKNPMIVVDKMFLNIGIFDGPVCVREHRPFACGAETEAVAEAHEWLKTRTHLDAPVVYARVSRLQTA